MFERTVNYLNRIITSTSQWDKNISIDEKGQIDQSKNDENFIKNIKELFNLFPNNSYSYTIDYTEGNQKSAAYIKKEGSEIDQTITGAAIDKNGGIPLSIKEKNREKLNTKVFVGLAASLIQDPRFKEYAISKYQESTSVTYDEVLVKVQEILAEKNHSEENHSKDWREKEDAKSGVSTIGR